MSRSRETPPDLPGPEDRLQADVVIYDGRCKLCTKTCRWLHRLDRKGRLAYLSLFDDQIGLRYPDLSREELLQHVYVIEPEGQRHKGAEAVRYLSRRLPALWPFVPILHIPGSFPLWRGLYQWVTKNRYWLSGEE